MAGYKNASENIREWWDNRKDQTYGRASNTSGWRNSDEENREHTDTHRNRSPAVLFAVLSPALFNHLTGTSEDKAIKLPCAWPSTRTSFLEKLRCHKYPYLWTHFGSVFLFLGLLSPEWWHWWHSAVSPCMAHYLCSTAHSLWHWIDTAGSSHSVSNTSDISA